MYRESRLLYVKRQTPVALKIAKIPPDLASIIVPTSEAQNCFTFLLLILAFMAFHSTIFFSNLGYYSSHLPIHLILLTKEHNLN